MATRSTSAARTKTSTASRSSAPKAPSTRSQPAAPASKKEAASSAAASATKTRTKTSATAAATTPAKTTAKAGAASPKASPKQPPSKALPSKTTKAPSAAAQPSRRSRKLPAEPRIVPSADSAVTPEQANAYTLSPGHEHSMECAPAFAASQYLGSHKLRGKTVLITGGDSGIGRAVAVLCAREGANVAIAYYNEHQDAKTTCKYIEAEGMQSLAIAGDVRDPAFCQQAVALVVQAFGGLNVLINNAAHQHQSETLADITPVQLEATFATNIHGYIYMTQAALPHLQRGDCIINTGSVSGLNGCECLMDYAASKGAIHAWTKSLALNLADRGIRVNAVAPGPVWTPLNPESTSEDDFANFATDTTIGRPAQPEEISPAYIFLAAPVCSSYITGMVLPVTGTVGDGA